MQRGTVFIQVIPMGSLLLTPEAAPQPRASEAPKNIREHPYTPHCYPRRQISALCRWRQGSHLWNVDCHPLEIQLWGRGGQKRGNCTVTCPLLHFTACPASEDSSRGGFHSCPGRCGDGSAGSAVGTLLRQCFALRGSILGACFQFALREEQTSKCVREWDLVTS